MMEWLIMIAAAILTAWYFSSRRRQPGAGATRVSIARSSSPPAREAAPRKRSPGPRRSFRRERLAQEEPPRREDGADAPPADTGLRIVRRPEAPAPPPTETIASIAKRARKYRDIRFVADVLKHYRKTGSMSPKRAAALYRIIVEREAEDAAIARDESNQQS
jgi:hypothetical protein